MEVYFSIVFGYVYPLISAYGYFTQLLGIEREFQVLNVYLLFIENRRGEIIHHFARKTADCYFSSLTFLVFHLIS